MLQISNLWRESSSRSTSANHFYYDYSSLICLVASLRQEKFHHSIFLFALILNIFPSFSYILLNDYVNLNKDSINKIMNRNNPLSFILIQTVSSVFRYISSLFLTFLVCDFLTVFLMSVTNSGFEKIIIMLITYTPFQKNWGNLSSTYGINDILSIFTFWSLIIFFISIIIDKLFRPKKIVNPNILFFAILTTLHFIATIRQPQMLTINIIFYAFSLVSWFLYRGINRLSSYLDSLFKRLFTNSEM